MLVVGLGTPEESEPDVAIELDGAVVELAIPADVTTAGRRQSTPTRPASCC